MIRIMSSVPLSDHLMFIILLDYNSFMIGYSKKTKKFYYKINISWHADCYIIMVGCKELNRIRKRVFV